MSGRYRHSLNTATARLGRWPNNLSHTLEVEVDAAEGEAEFTAKGDAEELDELKREAIDGDFLRRGISDNEGTAASFFVGLGGADGAERLEKVEFAALAALEEPEGSFLVGLGGVAARSMLLGNGSRLQSGAATGAASVASRLATITSGMFRPKLRKKER
jgi:hypothetical protein